VAGSLALSALVAALPVVVLLGLLAFGHVKAHWRASATAASLLPAGGIGGMLPGFTPVNPILIFWGTLSLTRRAHVG